MGGEQPCEPCPMIFSSSFFLFAITWPHSDSMAEQTELTDPQIKSAKLVGESTYFQSFLFSTSPMGGLTNWVLPPCRSSHATRGPSVVVQFVATIVEPLRWVRGQSRCTYSLV